jgi:drug/metabolite transporter (DMT)-like permease
MPSLALFSGCVLIWGTTWLAIIYQLGIVPPEVSVGWRFLLASALLFAWCLWRRLPLAFDRRMHAALFTQGLWMFCISYILVYHAEQHIVSGLVAVGYSASPLLNMLGAWIAFRTPMTRRVLAGGALGVIGICLVFASEFGELGTDRATLLGVTFTVLSVLASTGGSIAALWTQRLKLPVWQNMAWSMAYGGGAALLYAALVGKPLTFVWSAAYVGSLVYLAVFGSVFAFAGYLTLMARIGAARAGYIGVMVPILALLISSVFESFQWGALTVLGAVVSLIGNVIILKRSR